LKLLITEIPWDDDNNLNGFYQVVGGRCFRNLVSNSISGRLRLSYLNIAYFPTAACRVPQCVPVCVCCDSDCIGVVMATTRTRRTRRTD